MSRKNHFNYFNFQGWRNVSIVIMMLQGQSYLTLFHDLVQLSLRPVQHIAADRSRSLHFESAECIHDFFIVPFDLCLSFEPPLLPTVTLFFRIYDADLVPFVPPRFISTHWIID